jgi:hypothetical protein
MDDELLARQAALIGMVEAGVGKGALDAVAIDRKGLIGVLLDDGEQVPQQPALERRQLGVLDRGAIARGGETVDAGALGGEDRAGPVLGRGRLAVGARVTAADRAAQAPARRFALFRYR